MSDIPVLYRWDGDAMVPLDRFKKYCDKQFVVGEVYPLITEYDRSTASHRHYFAVVNGVWQTLPPALTALFPTSERLRKWCLIKCGYANEQAIVCETMKDANNFAALITTTMEDCVVVQSGRTLKVFTAQSQSTRSMDKVKFQESKDAVFGVLAEMLGVTVEQMLANTGQTT
jgi:hypothetical protein